jgi:predicted SprT family Zn-dependent metalloprotease
VIHTEEDLPDLRDTIRHELAHIVAMQRNRYAEAHSPIWLKIAHSLGCSGNIRHEMQVYRRPKKRFEITCKQCRTMIGTITRANSPRGWDNKRHINCGGSFEFHEV